MTSTLRPLLALAALAAAASASAAPGFRVAPPPAWVEPVDLPAPGPASPDASGGVDYLLVDSQVRGGGPAGPERFHRTVQRVLASTGVEHASEFRVDFDPAYQSLTLHEVVIQRGAARLAALRSADVKLIQREPELDRRLYDGRLTAVIYLRDVRQGDLVEASWTVRGQNPVFGPRTTQVFDLGWGVPVARLAVRLTWPAARPLAWRVHGLELEPERATRGDEVELRFRREGVAALDEESDLPPGVDAFPWLEASEWLGWDEVVRWALPLYAAPPPSRAMEAALAGWRTLPDEEARARAALRFVQDEVRYLGIELGTSSHRPAAPAEVFARRFGDCKDKSLLLVSLLSAMGIEAAPALVNTAERAGIAARLPSPSAFDHVVVRARVAGAVRWLEPTRSLERAPLGEVTPPPYARALVLAAGEVGLVELPEPAPSPLQVTSTWRVTRFGAPVLFDVVTRFDGLRAVGMRHDLSDTPPPELQRRYLDHYAHTEPKVEVAAPMLVEDAPDADRVTITEHYRLPSVAAGAERDFVAEAIRDHLLVPDTARRRHPLQVRHPVLVREQLRVELPGPPNLTEDEQEVVGEVARLSRRARPEGRGYVVDLEYRTLRPTVEPASVAKHIAAVREMRGVAAYSLALAVRQGPVRQERGPSWASLGLVALAFAGGLGLYTGVTAARNGDLARWWAALRNRRRRRAFTAAFAEASGETAREPIVLRSTDDLPRRAQGLRCRCGSPIPPEACSFEPLVLGGRPLWALRAPCPRCAEVQRAYFAVEG